MLHGSDQIFNHPGPTLLAGKVVCDYGQSVTDCIVRRITERGATIELESPFGIPDHFHLLIRDRGPPRPSKVVWQSGKELGLEFEQLEVTAKNHTSTEKDQPEDHDQPSSTGGQLLALRSALDEIQIGVVLLSSDMRVQICNRAFRRMWNVPDALAEKKPSFMALLYHVRDTHAYRTAEPDLDAFIAGRLRMIKAGDPKTIDLRRADGEVIRMQCTALPNGGRLLTYATVTDIVAHVDELEVLYKALDTIQDGVLLLDAHLNAQFLNAPMRAYFGVTEQQAATHPPFAALIASAPGAGPHGMDPGQLDEFIACRLAAVQAVEPSVLDLQIADGRHIRVHCSEMANGGRMLTYCDVTDLIRNAEQLERLATTDSLTSLYNRRHFMELAATEWSRYLRHRRPLSMLMIDIDHFKLVNDRYGHAAGDDAIASIAATCRESKRAADIVGRLGGEEFAILLPETDQVQARVLAERIREKVAGRSLSTQGVEFSMTISVGIAAASADMSGADALLRAADRALYQAKADGRNRTAEWSPEPASSAAAK
jgi:diguanylate cyclase (GGDEF)-like protein